MMMLITAGILLGLILTAAALLWLSVRQHERLVQGRLLEVTGAYVQLRSRRRLLRRSEADVAHAVRQRLETLLGYRRARQPHYGASLRSVLLVAGVVALGMAVVLSRLFGTLGWALLPVCWVGLVRFRYGQMERKLASRLYVQFPDALAMIIRAVRVGVPVTEAVRMVAAEAQAPTTVEFKQLSDEVAVGVSLDQALREMGARNGLPEYRFFATALALQSQTGGGLTETLDTLADTIRKRVAARSRGHALASEARTSCYILAVLPLIVGAGIYATNPDYISVLFTTSGGNKLLALASASLGTGLFSMRMIIRKSLS